MRKFALGLVASVLAFSSAFAGDPMASRYENTVTITDASGAVTKIYYNKDGTLKTVAADGTEGAGKWAVKDGKLCVTLDSGPNAGVESCSPLMEHNVGDEWEVTLPNGSKLKVKLVAGR